MNELFNFVVVLLGVVCYFFVGFIWSLSTWRHGFDMGWLLVAFLVACSISSRIEHGKLTGRDYAGILWPALPGVVLEWLSDSSLHDFRMGFRPGGLLQFAIFSCLFLTLIAVVNAIVRFGIGIKDLSVKDAAICRDAAWIGAIATTISVVLGTLLVFVRSGHVFRLSMLQSWLYKMSLVVYLLVTIKMMLPLIINRYRVAFRSNAVL